MMHVLFVQTNGTSQPEAKYNSEAIIDLQYLPSATFTN